MLNSLVQIYYTFSRWSLVASVQSMSCNEAALTMHQTKPDTFAHNSHFVIFIFFSFCFHCFYLFHTRIFHCHVRSSMVLCNRIKCAIIFFWNERAETKLHREIYSISSVILSRYFTICAIIMEIHKCKSRNSNLSKHCTYVQITFYLNLQTKVIALSKLKSRMNSSVKENWEWKLFQLQDDFKVIQII